MNRANSQKHGDGTEIAVTPHPLALMFGLFLGGVLVVERHVPHPGLIMDIKFVLLDECLDRELERKSEDCDGQGID